MGEGLLKGTSCYCTYLISKLLPRALNALRSLRSPMWDVAYFYLFWSIRSILYMYSRMTHLSKLASLAPNYVCLVGFTTISISIEVKIQHKDCMCLWLLGYEFTDAAIPMGCMNLSIKIIYRTVLYRLPVLTLPRFFFFLQQFCQFDVRWSM